MKHTIIFLLTIFPILAFSQGILIADTVGLPEPSAGLEIDFDNRGFLLPRMTTAQRDSISNPADGLQIFNSTSECLEMYVGGWITVKCKCSLIPNAGFTTNPTNPTVGNPAAITPNYGSGSHNWSFQNGSPSSSSAINPSVTWSSVGTFAVTHIVDSAGCIANITDSVTVICPLPSSGFSYTSNQLTVNLTNSSTGGTSYSWDFGDGNSSTSTSPSHTYSTDGTYTICLIATSVCGSDTSCQTVSVTNCPAGADTFTFTGAMQTFVVPTCVTSVNIKVWGAQGGSSTFGGNTIQGGLGGYAEGDLAVTGGQTLYVAVGGQGSPSNQRTAGWNGGGCAGSTSSQGYGGSGGDGTDVRVGGQSFSNRVIVAGGGGGAWANPTWPVGSGGAGGGTTGGNWGPSQANGGTQTAGGVIGGGSWNFNGGFGYGGVYTSTPWPSGCGNGGGGGGGWYGGSAASGCCAGPGAGGSGYIGGVTNGSMQSGVRSGNGLIIITY